ncbi:MAG: hypothetical protein U0670_07850 [Anaerolineae bacterium]
MADDSLALSILNSLDTRIAVIDGTGTIRLINDAWVRFARENGDPALTATGIGINYLDATQRALDSGDPLAGRALVGIGAVMHSQRPRFELKYPCHAPDEERWFLMRVTPLENGADFSHGAVITHIDITAQHMAARTLARNERRRALAVNEARQAVREQRTLDQFSEHAQQVDADAETSGTAAEPFVSDEMLITRYAALIDLAVERRALKIDADANGDSRRFAAILGQQMASPRDLIRIHTRAIEAQKKKGIAPARVKIMMEEGRLMLLEIMGYLAAFYRDLLVADLST